MFLTITKKQGAATVIGLTLLLVSHSRLLAFQSDPGAKIVGCAIDNEVFGSLPGIEIRLAGGSTERVAVTGEDGCYELASLAPGNYTLSAENVVFVSEPREVVVPQAGTLMFDFVMRLQATAVREPPLVIQSEPGTQALPMNQGPGIISGCVTDSMGRPLPGAEVTILEIGSTEANDSGCFLVAVAPGRYRLIARAGVLESQKEGPIPIENGSRIRCPVLVAR